MELGLRERVLFPESYGDFRLIRTHGRVFAIPEFLDPDEVLHRGRLHTHPGVLSAPTLEEVQALIDDYDDTPYRPEPVESFEGYSLVRKGGAVYGVPQSAGLVDLNVDEDRRRAGVVRGATLDEVRERIRAARETMPVEFAGWLPIFEWAGNCGKHPQFAHSATPPTGYRFVRSAPPQGRLAPTIIPRKGPRRILGMCARGFNRLRNALKRRARLLSQAVRPLFAVLRGQPKVSWQARWRTLASLARMFVLLRRGGGRLGAVLQFLQSRHYQSQLLQSEIRRLVFLTSVPYTYNQNPWVLEIEDPTTLFYPFIQNGHTLDLRPHESPYFPIVKALLESDQCRGILTHVRSTAELVPTLFKSEKITRKLSYAPIGVPLPERWQRHDGPAQPEHIDLLFINSWCQVPTNFYVRGGLDILEAFAVLRERYPQLRLTMRTNLPALDDYYHRLLTSGWVRVIDRFVSTEEMAALHADSHIYLLPAARIHVVSLLQAMSYGLAVVTSDGWGIEEYVTHERNGLIVKGRYGKTSWADRQTGFLRENYEPIYTPDPEVVDGLVEAVSRLVEDVELRRRLGRTGRRDVETQFTVERWNDGLKGMLDKALATG